MQKVCDCWEKSAKLNAPALQFNLGKMYASGKGLEQDADKALFWLEKATLQNDAFMHNHLSAKCLKMALAWSRIQKLHANGMNLPLIMDLHKHNIF